MIKKKGQFWYGDFIIGILIIVFIGILFAKSIIDIPQRESDLQLISQNAVTIANLLMSPGVNSVNWKNSEGKIGIVEKGKVNFVWLSEFLNLVESTQAYDGYQTAKLLFGTSYDFSVYFERKNGEVYNNKAYGGIDDLNQLQNLSAENIVRLSRVVYFDGTGDQIGEVMKMNLVVWDFGTEKLTSQVVCNNAQNCELCIALEILIPDYRIGCQSEWTLCSQHYPPKDPAKCPF